MANTTRIQAKDLKPGDRYISKIVCKAETVEQVETPDGPIVAVQDRANRRADHLRPEYWVEKITDEEDSL